MWWIGPLIGAIVAAVIYRYALEGEAEPDVTPATQISRPPPPTR